MNGHDLRMVLRDATAEVHQRLHGHAGLGAVADGTISHGDYRALLTRLWGFHRGFETTVVEAVDRLGLEIDLDERARSGLIEADLLALGMRRDAIACLPACCAIHRPRNEAEVFGSLYVIEGSTLGGQQLARALGTLLGTGSVDGRRFFLGYGESHGAMWRAFLARLDALAGDAATEADVVVGAQTTFHDFEAWMAGWIEAGLQDESRVELGCG
jgi:heme oxygenase